MKEIKMEVEGMHCGMCEAHVNDAVRKAVPAATRVKSSHRKGITTFIAPEGSGAAAKRAVEALGYRVGEPVELPHAKRSPFRKIFGA